MLPTRIVIVSTLTLLHETIVPQSQALWTYRKCCQAPYTYVPQVVMGVMEVVVVVGSTLTPSTPDHGTRQQALVDIEKCRCSIVL